MQARGGMARLALLVWLALSICLPGKVSAADGGWNTSGLPPQSVILAASSPLEAQMLGEKPTLSSPNQLRILGTPLGRETARGSGTTLHFPHNLELNVSFLYNRDPHSLDPRRSGDSLPLFNYSMDYRLFPNFRVGLSGYLYHSYADQPLSLSQPFSERVVGLGPGLKYDLGRWSFVVKSQVETGSRDRGDDFQNWFRVWYAF